MDIKFVNKINQQYDVGRVKNLSVCDCESCDFVNCPKNNYSAEKTLYVYSVDEFVNEYGRLLKSSGFAGELVSDFFESCVDYPSDYYYSVDDMDSRKIYIVKLKKGGESQKACFTIDGGSVSIVNKGLSKDEYKWCLSILRDIEKILKEV